MNTQQITDEERVKELLRKHAHLSDYGFERLLASFDVEGFARELKKQP